jgi:DNA-binding MarR family transcriptional regulator
MLSIMEGRTIHMMAGHLIRRLHQISTSVFQSAMKDAGLELSPVQFAALDALSRAAGVDQATLAGMIAYDRATIGSVVDRMEARGLVSRRPSRSDRRAREVQLTAAGRALLETAWPVVAALQTDILIGLTAQERDRFLDLAARIAAAGNTLSRAPLVAPKD